MNYGKSCDSCQVTWCSKNSTNEPCIAWEPIYCPYCAGFLSEIREHKGRRYRHCSACNFEFFLDGNGQAVPMETS